MTMQTATRRRRIARSRGRATAAPLAHSSGTLSHQGVATGAPSAPSADLALNQPGQAAHEQALLSRQAAPVRTILGRALGLSTNEQAWRLAAEGTAKVAGMLAQLDERWHVLHSVPLGTRSAAIDHFVVGPGGAYSLTTRHHPGASILIAGDLFMADGQRQTYPETARRDAAVAQARLSSACGMAVSVTGLVVAVGAEDFLVKRAPADIGIVTRARVNRWLTERPEVLSASDIARIYAFARRCAVWQ